MKEEAVEKKVEVTIGGKKYVITKKKIEMSLKDIFPRRTTKYSVSINNKSFPIKQVIAETLKISPLEFGSSIALKILKDLGFEIIKKS